MKNIFIRLLKYSTIYVLTSSVTSSTFFWTSSSSDDFDSLDFELEAEGCAFISLNFFLLLFTLPDSLFLSKCKYLLGFNYSVQLTWRKSPQTITNKDVCTYIHTSSHWIHNFCRIPTTKSIKFPNLPLPNNKRKSSSLSHSHTL